MSVGWSRGSNLMKVSRNFGRDWISLDSVDITQLFISRELPSAIELAFFFLKLFDDPQAKAIYDRRQVSPCALPFATARKIEAARPRE